MKLLALTAIFSILAFAALVIRSRPHVDRVHRIAEVEALEFRERYGVKR